jgi:hypothetical protein
VEIEMTIEEMKRLLDKDDRNMERKGGLTLLDRLLKINLVRTIEYDGMFNAFIWLDIDCPPGKRLDRITNRAIKIIQKYVN